MSGGSPSVVFGLPAYNGERHFREAIESLLAQSRTDLAVIVVDDGSVDRTPELALEYAALDPRVSYERNDHALGLVRNWRRGFELARARFPEAAYFAWASDHDVWHPDWATALAGELDAAPEAVLAYPMTVRIDDQGAEYPTRERRFETRGVSESLDRLRRSGRDLSAGEMIYGLFRSDALERCGPFPLVVLPDRLQLLRLALDGEFRQVPRRLWYRRYRAGVTMSNRRQRQAAFPDRVPLRAHVPWWIAHAALFARATGSARLGLVVLADSVRQAYGRRRVRAKRDRRWRRRERHRRRRALAAALLGTIRRRSRPSLAAPAPTETCESAPDLALLERAEALEALRRPGAVALHLGVDTTGIAGQLASRYPATTVLVGGDALPGRVDVALSVGFLEQLAASDAEAWVRRLYELGVPTLLSLDRESETLHCTLSRRYWLRELWIEAERRGRRPDPTTRPIVREDGRRRHVVGRRRLVVDHADAGLG